MVHNNYELSLGKKIQEFKNRIQDLERINRMHEALNGQLRQEISRSDDVTTFNHYFIVFSFWCIRSLPISK